MATSTKLDLKPYYVYALADPTNDGRIFYVGKGKSIRGNDHLKEARRDLEKSSPKLDQHPENRGGGRSSHRVGTWTI